MKSIFYVCGLLVFFGCKSKTNDSVADTTVGSVNLINTIATKATTFTPYKLNVDYLVTDTGFFDAVVSEGTYAVVQRNKKLADTIDKSFSIQKIANDTYLYLTITGTGPLEKGISGKSSYKNSIMGSFGNYFIVRNGEKKQLNNLVQDFDDYFSSPYVIGNKIYFWQLKTLDKNGKKKISAAEYNPITKTLKSYYIKDDYLETDDSGYFPYPYSKNDTIYFDAGEAKLMKYSKEFKPY